MSSEPDGFTMSAREAARILDVTVTTIRRNAKAGRVAHVRDAAGRYWFRLEDLVAELERRSGTNRGRAFYRR
jgi:excisionase family DNA binding protein